MNKTKTAEVSTSETIRKIGRTTYIVSSTYAEENNLTPYEFVYDDG